MQDDVTVACLCAAWCTTCADYRRVFASLAASRSDLRFAWIDIEDDADALGDDALDIDDFPTVTVLQGAQVVFHGTLLPHRATLERLLQALDAQALAPGAAAEVSPSMAAAVRRLALQRPLSPATCAHALSTRLPRPN